ncbi:ArsR/SmtB family transcription factor [Edaphobacter aggregans]|uniref:ArsR/SmtB family transcription factor n=1 Tax=Edaphobacter aggregans TaxID=570835 RepID=UPI000553B230|nr:metalloregulator ArsR/SmtB family transcription factor [Edaphobacter aggregans]
MGQLTKQEFKDAAYSQLGRIGKALASPKRLELLDLLCQAERTVEALAAETRMSVANTSQHLQLLQAARLVEASKNGRYVVYRMADILVGDFFRSFRLLAENRLAEIEQIRRRFFSENGALDTVDRDTLLQRVQQRKAIVIDVRPATEFLTAHIANAMPMPLEQLKQRLSELPRNKEIVAYCRGPFCVLAKEAVELLRSHGFRATRLEDSVQDWLAHGLPVATGEEQVRSRSMRHH